LSVNNCFIEKTSSLCHPTSHYRLPLAKMMTDIFCR
jgi:hypothetical protein